MKILQVIHGYPMLYNAGSEVYTQIICHGLINHGHDVQVFSRMEDSFLPDGAVRISYDHDEPRIKIHRVNNPRHRDRYRLDIIDQRLSELLERFNPDIVHIGHLNHLSISLVREIHSRGIPIIYTLHDYWLMCPRGQFMQMHSEDEDLWAACTGQDDRKCATQCYARYFSGAPEDLEQDLTYWENWVKRRMDHVRSMVELVDLFVSPAKYLKQRYENDFGLSSEKIVYLDYGFNRSRMAGRQRIANDSFTFGYIGTHIPAKGIHQLITAFGQLKGNCQLRIWGRDRGQDSQSLRAIVETLPVDKRKRVIWMPEYKNQRIAQDVFRFTDAIVVPSIWVENSPLVIHEAQQSRIPVITANAGGMGEYVHHEVNGLLYQHRDVNDLTIQMQRLLDNPSFAQLLGERGFLYSEDGEIPAIDEHIKDLEVLYKRIMK